MTARFLLGLLLGLSASSARAAVDPKVVEALTYVRDAPDHGAMWAYLRMDPIPVAFCRLPLGVDSRYVRRSGKAWIDLSDRLREEPGRDLGRELYHQYIHRLQDRAPTLVTAAQAETPAGYEVAMRYLRSQVRPGGELPEAPAEVRAVFGVGDRLARQDRPQRRRGTVIQVYTSGR